MSITQNPYTFMVNNDFNINCIIKKEYNYDGVYGPIPDENGYVDLSNYAKNYIKDFNNITEIPKENLEYLQSGLKAKNMFSMFGSFIGEGAPEEGANFNIPFLDIDTTQCTTYDRFLEDYGMATNVGNEISFDLSFLNLKNCISLNNFFYSLTGAHVTVNNSNWDTSNIKYFINFMNTNYADIEFSNKFNFKNARIGNFNNITAINVKHDLVYNDIDEYHKINNDFTFNSEIISHKTNNILSDNNIIEFNTIDNNKIYRLSIFDNSIIDIFNFNNISFSNLIMIISLIIIEEQNVQKPSFSLSIYINDKKVYTFSFEEFYNTIKEMIIDNNYTFINYNNSIFASLNSDNVGLLGRILEFYIKGKGVINIKIEFENYEELLSYINNYLGANIQNITFDNIMLITSEDFNDETPNIIL